MKDLDIMVSFMRIFASIGMLLIVAAPTLVYADRAPVSIEGQHA